jgi:predicted Zn-ribbon and HTH transcriptional regulator
MTRREEIISSLTGGRYSLLYFVEKYSTTIKDILIDFRHISQSIRPKKIKIVEPAECKRCGFKFKDDNKFRIPSKCPRCRCGAIYAPTFTIK